MRLTKTAADAAGYPHGDDSKRRHVLWDDAVTGFGLRVYPSGNKTFVFRYELAGRQRWLTIGEYGPLTVQQARKRAMKARALAADGEDPARARQERAERHTALRELADEHLDDLAPSVKASTLEGYRRLLDNHILPTFGTWRCDAITEADVRRWHRKVGTKRPGKGRRKRGGPYAANRSLELLRSLLDTAHRRGLRSGPNPCDAVEDYRESKRERFLSAAELARVGDALGDLEDAGKVSTHAAAAIRLLLFTGCRTGEILKLRWSDLDLERGIANLPDAKAGARAVHLNAPALAVIDSLPRTAGHPFVIEGQKAGERMKSLQRPWGRVREAAGVPDVRLHDLRHTVGAWGASGGDSLLIVGALLGHRRAASTERYAHLAADPVRQASERVGAAIATALEGDSGDVVEMRQARRREAADEDEDMKPPMRRKA